MLRTPLVATVLGLLIPAAQLQAQTCKLIDGELHVDSAQECTMPVEVSAAPIELSYWVMGDGSKVILPKTEAPDNTWNITAAEAAFGYGVMIDARGQSGSGGNNGVFQGGGVPDCGKGRPGTTGSDGLPGAPGQSVDLQIAFVELGSLTIDTSGGAGGIGGNGGNGQRGGKADVSDNCRGGKGGSAGAGGQGGQGGDGGHITMRIDMSHGIPIPLLEKLNFEFAGGVGGSAGKAGKPGAGGRGVCRDWGLWDVCKGGGPGGSTPGASSEGDYGEFGALKVTVEETFSGGDDLGVNAGVPTRTKSAKAMRTACGRVFSHLPRFVSFFDNYVVDKPVHSYMISNLEMASLRENAGLHTDAKAAYRSILTEMEIVEKAVLGRYWSYKDRLDHVVAIRDQIMDLTNVIKAAPQTGCLAKRDSDAFDQCRSRCMETSRTEKKSHDDAGSSEQNGKNGKSSKTWKKKGSSEETETVNLSKDCVASCMDTVLQAMKYEACGDVVTSVSTLRASLAATDGTFPTLTLGDVILTRTQSGESRAWSGPLVVEHEGALRSTCASTMPDSDGIRKCGSYGASRWRQQYDCKGDLRSSE